MRSSLYFSVLRLCSRFVNVVATFGGRKRGPNSKPAE